MRCRRALAWQDVQVPGRQCTARRRQAAHACVIIRAARMCAAAYACEAQPHLQVPAEHAGGAGGGLVVHVGGQVVQAQPRDLAQSKAHNQRSAATLQSGWSTRGLSNEGAYNEAREVCAPRKLPALPPGPHQLIGGGAVVYGASSQGRRGSERSRSLASRDAIAASGAVSAAVALVARGPGKQHGSAG